MSPFPTGCFTLFDVRQDPTRQPNFLKGNYPRPPSCYRGSDRGLTLYLPYVVEGHASACPQTVGVATLCGVVLTTRPWQRMMMCMDGTDNGKDKLVLLKVRMMFLLFICTFLQKKYKKKILVFIGF